MGIAADCYNDIMVVAEEVAKRWGINTKLVECDLLQIATLAMYIYVQANVKWKELSNCRAS